MTLEIAAGGAKVGQLAISTSDRLLLAASASGAVKTYVWPLESPSCVECLPMHASAITRMCLSADEACLFTASDDGQIFMYEMLGEGAAGRERARRKEEEAGGDHGDTVLVSKAAVLESKAAIAELEQKVRAEAMHA